MATNFYCKNCGSKYSSISSLTAQPCGRHPLGNNKGKHELYEGSEKSQYNCKYCGGKSYSISNLTAQPCGRHPKGNNKGHHEPAL
ncbi:MAG: hypothetical protein EOP48_26410 [Sphingobacteriales bacterium]|nr:MAG: hypothetical protein EOP48_26410 [Sphingobacteriales bacterium]